MQPYISIQRQDFDQHEHYSALAGSAGAGAIVTFVGQVREFAGEQNLWLEHYPGMTEKSLQQRIAHAAKRWPLLGVRVVHRVGELAPGAQIVFVGVSATHRHDAFHACEYLMDFLKTEAPFWKREGKRWIEAKASDQAAADSWLSNGK